MLNTSPTTNSFTGLDPLENRKQRITSLLNIKQEAEQMAAAGADPAAVKSMVQERRKSLGRQLPDEPSMKKSVNAAKKFQDMSYAAFDGPLSTPAPGGMGADMGGQMGGFNPGFGMSAPGAAPRAAAPAPNTELERGVDEMYRRAGFKGGPVREGMNDPGALLSMLPHDA
jgi:hypothetical protein